MLRNKLFCNTCETRSCFVIFLILILMITSFYWLLFIYLCESSYFVSMHFLFFCQVPSYSTPFYFIIFCSFLWNIHQKYLYLCEFAQCTLFLNWMWNIWWPLLFYAFCFPSEVAHLASRAHILFCLSKVWSILHQGSVAQVQNKIKNTLIYFQVLFRQFLLLFIVKFLFSSWCTI